MAKHENYDKYFEAAAALHAEGARIGLATCKICGAAVLIDPRDETNRPRQHAEWHKQERIGGEDDN
jgi:hypothetical protein